MGLIIYIISAFVIVLTTLSLLSSLFPLQANASVVLPNQDEEEQEIFLTLYDNSTFMPLTSGEGNQVSVFVNYEVHDDSIAGQRINAVMEVFAPNGTLIKTSSYPDGFIAQSSGGVEGLETTLKDKSIQSVTANVRFTDAAKTQIISNNISANLDLKGQITTTTGTTGGGGQGGAEGEDEGTFEAEGEEATAEEMTPQPPSQGDGGTSENTDEDEEEDGVEAESEAEEETSLDIPSSFG